MLALDLKIYNNGGNSMDLSLPVLERAMFHSDNVYEIPNMRIVGRVCFTNFPSHTAFRGFGGPQGMLIAENWIQRIAVEVRKSPEVIRVRYETLLYIYCVAPVNNFKLHHYLFERIFLSQVSFQEINFQGEGTVLHYGQELQYCTLVKLWDELKLSCDFAKAKEDVDKFNGLHRWRKRGISMVPTKFGISFTTKFMNQVISEFQQQQ